MKRELLLAVSLALLCASSARPEGPTRHLGAHEHGHSVLNIAIDGDRVEMELIAPGADIVGFEHEAASADDEAVVAEAKAALGEPLALFGFTDAAGCTVETVSVEIEGEEHQDEHGEEHAEADHKAHQGEASHNEFHAAYALTCNAPDALEGIDFVAFFKTFAGAKEVEVTVIGEKGQSSYEVERDAAVIDLQGIM